MDCLSTPTRQTNRIGRTSIHNPVIFPKQEEYSALLHHLAELEQRIFLQSYEMHVLEAEMEVLRSESSMI